MVISTSFSLFQGQDSPPILIVTTRVLSALGKLMGISQARFSVILVTISEKFTEYWRRFLSLFLSMGTQATECITYADQLSLNESLQVSMWLCNCLSLYSRTIRVTQCKCRCFCFGKAHSCPLTIWRNFPLVPKTWPLETLSKAYCSNQVLSVELCLNVF